MLDHHTDNDSKAHAKAKFDLDKVFSKPKQKIDFKQRKNEIEELKRMKKLNKRRKVS